MEHAHATRSGKLLVYATVDENLPDNSNALSGFVTKLTSKDKCYKVCRQNVVMCNTLSPTVVNVELM